ncbi:hypothetical protein B7R54_15500 [Subtercola boreus]|uniref:Uncharacterized protein n=1 Tax=Subtercola boreus TaxID=120213 RepID=A0A3E0VLZ2_9MICO|nr:hypothetical protein [Subtercola boreus]RFA10450.1 hypothetical protein B7R54_15500 [Subtercola boreus]TQL56021.1 hypothetical protein FB464_3597 [Subtercola boreus]
MNNAPSTEPEQFPGGRTPSRRAVLRTAAWSVPVVAIAVGAPAFAASGGAATITAPDPMAADIGDSIPLVFQISENGAPLASGVLTVALNDASVVSFDPEGEGYSSATLASYVITDGYALPLVIVGSHGTVFGSATVGGVTTSFTASILPN